MLRNKKAKQDKIRFDKLKKEVAVAACKYVHSDLVLGVGTGTTVNFFIDELAKAKILPHTIVASSVATEKYLISRGFAVTAFNDVEQIDVYIDGADECNEYFQLIKGGGGAHAREKIMANCARKFICIIDESKYVKILGRKCPLPVDVVPFARSVVAKMLYKLGGNVVYRDNFITDNGDVILDVTGLNFSKPMELEDEIKAISGVVEHGLFAKCRPHLVLMATDLGVKELRE